MSTYAMFWAGEAAKGGDLYITSEDLACGTSQEAPAKGYPRTDLHITTTACTHWSNLTVTLHTISSVCWCKLSSKDARRDHSVRSRARLWHATLLRRAPRARREHRAPVYCEEF